MAGSKEKEMTPRFQAGGGEMNDGDPEEATGLVGQDPKLLPGLRHYSDTQLRYQGSSGKYCLAQG